ncbi:unnamed protein product [Brugia pahangi]|uniref:Uncharacterized protein n=1 Tax=Brugia pahangi TaxID=6280 RepID=A0A0N4TBG1_BRUPA|nr:unnamed protein product [Brugia pahangi]
MIYSSVNFVLIAMMDGRMLEVNHHRLEKFKPSKI